MSRGEVLSANQINCNIILTDRAVHIGLCITIIAHNIIYVYLLYIFFLLYEDLY